MLSVIGRFLGGSIRAGGSSFATITSLSTIIMIVMGTADILGTKLLGIPVPAAYETTEALMVALVFGGLAYAQSQKRHIKVTLLVSHFPSKMQAISEFVGILIGTIFFFFLTWTSIEYFWQSWLVKESEPSIIRFPIYPSKFLMVLGASLVTLQLLVDLFYSIKKLLSRNMQGAS
jgi:TRAP-type C4-dicarboxylate transport system permease small subunit